MSTDALETVPAVSNMPPEVTVDPIATDLPTSITLDEQIKSATVSNYQDVLSEIVLVEDEVVRDSYIAKLAKTLGINKALLVKQAKKQVDAGSQSAESDDAEGTKKAIFPGLVDLVKDDAGRICYLMKQDDGLHLAQSWVDTDGYTCIPPEQRNIEFQLPDATRVLSYFEDSDDNRIYEDLLAFFKRFSYLEDDVWPIIILSVFLSYIQDHHDVRYIPGIYFYAAAERGKSRTAKTMLSTSYRGIHLVDIRTANVVRFSERLNATLFFDVTDLWKSAEKGDSCDILLGRFEKGTRVARVLNPDKGPFDDQTFFSVYGSTIFATNEPANSIFESRCLSITMPNKPGHYDNLTPEMGLPFKDRLTAWRARMMDKHLPQIDPIPGIGGRLWDISQPLFQLALLVAPDSVELMTKVVQEMAGHKVENKRDTLEGQIVAAIDQLVDKKAPQPWEISVESIRSRVNSFIAIEQYRHSPQKMGRRIQSLSIKSKKLNGVAWISISEQELEVLKEQHGLLTVSVPGETLPLATTRQGAATTAPDAGRESEESQQPGNNSPSMEPAEIQRDRQAVESSSELPTSPATENSHQAYLTLITGTKGQEPTEATDNDQPEKAKVIDLNEYASKTSEPDPEPLAEERPRAKIQFRQRG